MIRQNENHNAFLKIISLLFRINNTYRIYHDINTIEVADLYFRLYGQLSIKNTQDSCFNLWKACTTIDKTKTIDFMDTLECYFSEKKRRYI